MNIRHVPGPAVAVLALCLLSACSAPDSAITLNFEVDGDTRTVVMHPSSVECSSHVVVGTAADSEPVGTYGFTVPDGSMLGSGDATFGERDEVIAFSATEVPLDVTDGHVSVPSTEGVVKIGQRTNVGGSTSGYEETTGVISAELDCDTTD